MVLIRETAPDEWPVLRDIRLTALADAPDAFASTYAREKAFGEADWQARLAGCFELEPGVVELVSMWVRPKARGHGVGAALIAAVIDWAKVGDATAVHLWLNEDNDPARLLYQRCGFLPGGERQPLPSNPHLYEVDMVRPL
jgi:GNAT superfamily N-acetyltransferase